MILNDLPWKQMEIVLLFLRFHPSTAFWTLLLTMIAMDCSLPGSPSMKFSRPEYWSGLPFSSPEDLPNPGIKPWSPSLQVGALPSEPSGKPNSQQNKIFYLYIGKHNIQKNVRVLVINFSVEINNLLCLSFHIKLRNICPVFLIVYRETPWP